MNSFIQRKLIQPVLGLIKQGANPSKLALAISLGIVIGFVPVFGTCTILCLAAIWIFKVNPAATLLANQVAYPLQFVLYFPFIRTGEWVFNQPPVPFSFEEITQLFSEDFIKGFSLIGWSTLYALIVWFVLSWPIVYGLQFFFKMMLERTAFRKGKISHQEAMPE